MSTAATLQQSSTKKASDYTYLIGKITMVICEFGGIFLFLIGAYLIVSGLIDELDGRFRLERLIMDLVPGATCLFMGLLTAAMSQIMRAIISTAETNQKILEKLSN
ncbi:hypothetical protein VST7929_01479 [Vibrio stylophorae]|uniref:Uncharacterized protein n=1 Tax=Vibrio stylophorae TaxID=659351 RepID=A0ABM8ZTW8_9VIBR|nr:hypothetical protein [Vibrio stylophorae]CAH0533609.1 hypothetical protein VST7929_01479 [Vibrio stylophorae]